MSHINLHFKKLNADGFAHVALFMLFLVVFAVCGVGYLVISHADQLSANCVTTSTLSDSGSLQHNALAAGAKAPATCATTTQSANAQIASHLSSDLGINSTQATNYVGLQNKTYGIDNSLQTALGTNYAGTWFDNSTQKLVIGVTSDSGAENSVLANRGIAASSTTVAKQTFSFDKLAKDYQALETSLADQIKAQQARLSLDIVKNRVDIGQSSAATAATKTKITNLLAKYADTRKVIVPAKSLNIVADDGVCVWDGALSGCFGSALAGGESLLSEGQDSNGLIRACTLGATAFVNGVRYIITAGHCIAANLALGSSVWDTPYWQSGVFQGIQSHESSGTQYALDSDGDIGLIQIPGKYLFGDLATSILWGQPDINGSPPKIQNLDTLGIPPVGTAVCKPGISSQFTCGYLLSSDVAFTEIDSDLGIAPTIENGLQYSACSIPGDSGGPILSGPNWDNLVAINDAASPGSSANCTAGSWGSSDPNTTSYSFGTSYQEAQALWGITPTTAGNVGGGHLIFKCYDGICEY